VPSYPDSTVSGLLDDKGFERDNWLLRQNYLAKTEDVSWRQYYNPWRPQNLKQGDLIDLSMHSPVPGCSKYG